MGIDEVVQIVNRALYIICITAAPILLVSLVVGLLISIFQTATSIQEQTLTFVPKILSIFIALIFLGHWMLNNIVEYMVELWSDFAIYIR
ncbi:MAG: flagellar biosynthesis protein FliQ [Lachnospiraceae bacterium]|nr:flagellar biosynthesis protein FliQ [Lachnospiraceae bacterium]MDD7051323.1 flagellar biosynthesis protein FliQ [Lachnospiraceae bacterium]MDY3224160.1 flagellar biosynthesis protein FliQ [Lachnospiraceae bacterium]